jgi:hypothetical protein
MRPYWVLLAACVMSAIAAIMVVVGAACKSPARLGPAMAADFFPLGQGNSWVYRVESKSESYFLIDRVQGEKYVPAVKVKGKVVEEYYGISSGSVHPLVYYPRPDGYLTRVSGLDYSGDSVTAPPWGKSVEERFLPLHLAPDFNWDDEMAPFGLTPGAFHVVQRHRALRESNEILVPAGKFKDCIRIETHANYKSNDPTYPQMAPSFMDWYAPNVGLIRSLTFFKGGFTGPVTDRVELVSYNIGPRSHE